MQRLYRPRVIGLRGWLVHVLYRWYVWLWIILIIHHQEWRLFYVVLVIEGVGGIWDRREFGVRHCMVVMFVLNLDVGCHEEQNCCCCCCFWIIHWWWFWYFVAGGGAVVVVVIVVVRILLPIWNEWVVEMKQQLTQSAKEVSNIFTKFVMKSLLLRLDCDYSSIMTEIILHNKSLRDWWWAQRYAKEEVQSKIWWWSGYVLWMTDECDCDFVKKLNKISYS